MKYTRGRFTLHLGNLPKPTSARTFVLIAGRLHPVRHFRRAGLMGSNTSIITTALGNDTFLVPPRAWHLSVAASRIMVPTQLGLPQLHIHALLSYHFRRFYLKVTIITEIHQSIHSEDDVLDRRHRRPAPPSGTYRVGRPHKCRCLTGF